MKDKIMKAKNLYLTLFAVATFFTAANATAQGNQAPAVSVGPVVTVNENFTRKYAGRLYSIQDVSLPARVSGKIEYIVKKCPSCDYLYKEDLKPCPKCGVAYADGEPLEGKFVKAGTLLIKLEDTTYVAAKMAADAQISQAKAQISQAKAQMETALATEAGANAEISQVTAKLKKQTALLELAKINMEHAKKELERQTTLKSGNATTEQAFDESERAYLVAQATEVSSEGELAAAQADIVAAQAKLATAKAAKSAAEAAHAAATAALAAAEASLKDAENNLSYTRIIADFEGKIGKIAFSSGNYVTPSSGPLAQLIKFDPIYVVFSISEQDFLSNYGTVEALREKGIVRVRMADIRRTLYDKIAPIWIVDNKIDNTTGTIKIWARMSNTEQRLTPGGILDVYLSKKDGVPVPAVPISAIQSAKAGQFVYVLNGDNSVIPTPVITGDVIGDLKIIKRGLNVGQEVVIDGAHKIIPIPGTKLMVTPIRKPAAAVSTAN